MTALAAKVALEWNKMFLEIEPYAAAHRPAPAPRAIGLMGLTCHEACITGIPEFKSLDCLM